MEKINKTATEIFNNIVAKMGSNDSVKLDSNNGFMPLSVEKIGITRVFEVPFLKISMAHYYEQNGDLMADPEMIFLFNAESQIVYPCYYKQAGLGIERNSVTYDDEGNVRGEYRTMQKDQAQFANMWLRNIKEQQEL